MRGRRFLLASLGLALAWTYAGTAHAMFVNGSFETANYAGWTLERDSSTTWGIANTGQTIFAGDSVLDFTSGTLVGQFSTGLPRTYFPSHGNNMALQLQSAPGTQRMFQDVLLSASASELRWDMFYNNKNPGFNPTQFLAVYLRDTSNLLLDTLFLTMPGDIAEIAMTSFSSDVSAYAGKTVRLDVTLVTKNFFLDAGFDNFRIATVSVPEPASAALLGLSLLGFGLRKRRLR